VTIESPQPARVRKQRLSGLFRLWLVLLFAYATLDLCFNLLYFGWIDLRPVVFWKLLALPLGQAIVVWTIARRRASMR
jgi:hypothetical protein